MLKLHFNSLNQLPCDFFDSQYFHCLNGGNDLDEYVKSGMKLYQSLTWKKTSFVKEQECILHAASHGRLVTRVPLSHASEFCSSKAKRTEKFAQLKKGKELAPCTIYSVVDRVELEEEV